MSSFCQISKSIFIHYLRIDGDLSFSREKKRKQTPNFLQLYSFAGIQFVTKARANLILFYFYQRSVQFKSFSHTILLCTAICRRFENIFILVRMIG